MQTVLIVVHLMIVVALVGVVLLQRSEGGALGVGGGGGFMTGRGQANVLTRATAILAALFFVTSLSLTLLANYGRGSHSILEGAPVAPGTTAPKTAPPSAGEPAPTPAQGQGNVLDQLRKLEQQRTDTAAPKQTSAPGGLAPSVSPDRTTSGGTSPSGTPAQATPRAGISDTPANPPASQGSSAPAAVPTKAQPASSAPAPTPAAPTATESPSSGAPPAASSAPPAPSSK